MAGLFDIPRDDDAFYDSLPPLVPKGTTVEERERILEEIVAAWATPAVVGDESQVLDGVTLNCVAFWDAERNVLVELGEIVRRVLERVHAAPDGERQAPRVISIRGCRIASCDLSDLDFAGDLIRFQTFATCFGDGVRFKGATFGDGASFRNATFGDRAVFCEARFGNEARLDDARFGNEADFWGARLATRHD